jgi:hypothetical protein
MAGNSGLRQGQARFHGRACHPRTGTVRDLRKLVLLWRQRKHADGPKAAKAWNAVAEVLSGAVQMDTFVGDKSYDRLILAIERAIRGEPVSFDLRYPTSEGQRRQLLSFTKDATAQRAAYLSRRKEAEAVRAAEKAERKRVAAEAAAKEAEAVRIAKLSATRRHRTLTSPRSGLMLQHFDHFRIFDGGNEASCYMRAQIVCGGFRLLVTDRPLIASLEVSFDKIETIDRQVHVTHPDGKTVGLRGGVFNNSLFKRPKRGLEVTRDR